MKRYSAAKAREHLAEVLDIAEQGGLVVIERKGVEFTVRLVETAKRARRKRAPSIEILDPAVEAGDWSWDWNPKKGVTFRAGRKR